MRLRASAIALLAVHLLGCGKSKIAQCNGFIDRGNKSQTLLSSFNMDDANPSTLEGAAVQIDEEAKAIADVDLRDHTLVDLRDRYVKNLRHLGKNLRDYASFERDRSKQEKDHAELEAKASRIDKESERLQQEQSELIDKVNVYCTGSK